MQPLQKNLDAANKILQADTAIVFANKKNCTTVKKAGVRIGWWRAAAAAVFAGLWHGDL